MKAAGEGETDDWDVGRGIDNGCRYPFVYIYLRMLWISIEFLIFACFGWLKKEAKRQGLSDIPERSNFQPATNHGEAVTYCAPPAKRKKRATSKGYKKAIRNRVEEMHIQTFLLFHYIPKPA